MKLFNFDCGERPLVGKQFDEIDGVHTKPYIYAVQFVQGKSVLDCGCGGGYGSDYLARNGAGVVVAVDLSAWAVDQAKISYKRENLQFMTMDVCDLKFKDQTFDVVISFQVIEHIKDYKKHLSEIKKVLKPEGIFIISTPNKNITSCNREKPLFPFHLKEFCPEELSNLLSDYFREVCIMGQKTINEYYLKEEAKYRKSWRAKFIWFLSYFNPVIKIARLTPLKLKNLFTRPPKMRLKPEDLEISEKYSEDGYILIATCKKVEGDKFLFADLEKPVIA
jgi:ubiquinone/menaquinone biosynthesis C-methylase UbiE